MQSRTTQQPLPPELFLRPVMGTLSVKDEGEDRTAGRNLQIADGVYNTALEGVLRIFGPGFAEELPSLVRRDFRSVTDNIGDTFLIG